MKCLKLLFSIGFALCCNSAKSAVIDVFVTETNEAIADIKGEIVPNDGARFLQIAERYRKQGTPIRMVALDSPGGSVGASYQIAQYIIDHEIYTLIDDNALCASACFNIFIAANSRYASPSSKVGVHRISDTYYGDTDSARGSSIDMSGYFKDANVPKHIRLAMLETPPESMYYLTASDKNAVSTVDLQAKGAKPAIPKRNANEAVIEDMINQSSKHYDQKNYRAGIALLEKVRQISSRNPIVLGNLGWGYSKVGNSQSAIRYLTESLKIAPQNAIYWGYLAEVYADLGNIEYAKKAFVKMYQNSQDKMQAKDMLYAWSISYPNSYRDMAATAARQELGIY